MSTILESANEARHSELREQIVAALAQHYVPSLRGITIEVSERQVAVRGQVTSFYAKQLVHHSVRRLAAASELVDEVRVVTPASFRDHARLGRAAAAGVALLMAVAFVGCSKSESRLPVHPVTGQVTFNGKPAAGAAVVFHPKNTATNPTAQAKADAQGNFNLTTYQAGDGAAPGEYAVTVELRPTVTVEGGELGLGQNILPPQYSSPKTTRISVNVAEGVNSVPIKVTR